jgi:hypothetical protein
MAIGLLQWAKCVVQNVGVQTMLAMMIRLQVSSLAGRGPRFGFEPRSRAKAPATVCLGADGTAGTTRLLLTTTTQEKASLLLTDRSTYKKTVCDVSSIICSLATSPSQAASPRLYLFCPTSHPSFLVSSAPPECSTHDVRTACLVVTSGSVGRSRVR